jgi:hypothetical protein
MMQAVDFQSWLLMLFSVILGRSLGLEFAPLVVLAKSFA